VDDDDDDDHDMMSDTVASVMLLCFQDPKNDASVTAARCSVTIKLEYSLHNNKRQI